MLREAFWRFLAASLVRSSSVRQPHRLPSSQDRVEVMPIYDRYPGLHGLPSVVAKEVPSTEQMATRQLVLRRMALALKPYIPLWNILEPYLEDNSSYAPQLAEVTSEPWRPESFGEEHDVLADIATRGPFSLYTRRRADGDFEIDVSQMQSRPTSKGFLPGGGRAVYRCEQGVLKTLRIEAWGESYAPGDSGFGLARSRFLCGLGSWVTLADHITRIHVLICGTFSVCTVAHLPTEHPLRVLLQPTIVETIRVNNYFIGLLLGSEWSAAPSYTRYSLATIHEVIREESASFDLGCMDPVVDRNRREVGSIEGMVTLDSLDELWQVFGDHARTYCARFLAELDEPTRAWVRALDEAIPGGIRGYLEIDDLDLVGPEHVARLVCLHAYTASVRHHIVGEMTRNYYLYPQWFPPAVPEGGGPPPRGVVMEKANAIAVSAIQRYWLIDDSIPTLNAEALAIRNDFFAALRAYRERAASIDADFQYVVDPEALMSSVHQ